MSQNHVEKWPEGLQQRTAEEWNAIGAQWEVPENRKIIVDTLGALKVPAMKYARSKGDDRARMIIEIQEALVPGSTGGKKAAAPKAAAPKAAAGKPAAAPASAPAASQGGGGVDLGPVLTKLEALETAQAALAAQVAENNAILKLLLLNPVNADSLSLAASDEVVTEIGGKSIPELAAGNG